MMNLLFRCMKKENILGCNNLIILFISIEEQEVIGVLQEITIAKLLSRDAGKVGVMLRQHRNL
jgi:hypothetical protein